MKSNITVHNSTDKKNSNISNSNNTINNKYEMRQYHTYISVLYIICTVGIPHREKNEWYHEQNKTSHYVSKTYV